MAKALRLLLPFVLLVWGQSAAAHLTPNSELRLRPADGRLEMEIIVPAAEYGYATGNPVDDSVRSRDIARSYLEDSLGVATEDGVVLDVELADIRFAEVSGPPDLLALATVSLPHVERNDPILLRWSAVIDSVPNHFALVVMEAEGERQVLGSLRQSEQSLMINLEQGRMSAMLNAISLGAAHIVGGFDHLLFLLALLISSPLIAQGGRWVAIRKPKPALLRLAKVTTGFTLGHSLTLVIAGLANVSLPVAPVEALIALSVVVTALHAIRPIFAGHEAWVATGFGLIHGLAFATLAAGADGAPTQSILTLLGFNVGIELVQLAVLAAALPVLFLVMRCEQFRRFRYVAGVFTAVCGCIWLTQRLPDLFV